MFTKTLNNSCTIYCPVEILGSYNTPTGFQEQEIGYYPCRLSRKSLITAQKNPQTETSETYNLFLNPNINMSQGTVLFGLFLKPKVNNMN